MAMLRLLCFGALLLLAAAAALCAQTPRSSGSDDTLVLRAGDMLRVRVWPDSALGGDFPVEAPGVVLLPVVGSVRASGRSLADLRRELRQRYEQAMKLPVVTILPVFRVSVLGAVQRPGLYQVDPTLTLFDVISLAGGFRPDARENDVRVVREGAVLPVDARQALETGALPEALRLRSGDRIVVAVKHPGLSGLLFLQMATLAATIAGILTR